MINKGQGTQQISRQSCWSLTRVPGIWQRGEVGELCGQEDSSPKRPGQQAEKQRWWVPGSRSKALRLQDLQTPNRRSSQVWWWNVQPGGLSLPSSQSTWWPRIVPFMQWFICTYNALHVLYLTSSSPSLWDCSHSPLFWWGNTDSEWKRDLPRVIQLARGRDRTWAQVSTKVMFFPWLLTANSLGIETFLNMFNLWIPTCKNQSESIIRVQ